MGMKLKAWITCMNGSVNPGKLNQRKAYFSFFGEYICADKPIRQIWLSNNFLFSISNPKVFLMFISHHIYFNFKISLIPSDLLPLIELYSLKIYSIWINYVKFMRDTSVYSDDIELPSVLCTLILKRKLELIQIPSSFCICCLEILNFWHQTKHNISKRNSSIIRKGPTKWL